MTSMDKIQSLDDLITKNKKNDSKLNSNEYKVF